MKWCRIAIAAVIQCAIQTASAQEYPAWFLNQGVLRCGRTVVGFANTAFYKDSAIAFALRNGAEDAGRMAKTKIQGGQIYWSTEGGTFWMGADFREQFDSSAAQTALTSFTPIDTFISSSLVLVLFANAPCELDVALRSHGRINARAPSWTETIPRDTNYLYAVGIAPEYYYEISSWREAERIARRNLAGNVHIKIRALQKLTAYEGQDIRHEEISVTLKDIQVVARWRDLGKKIFYVLIRMPNAP
ncbi:MAG: LPP20 family lipoprotein [bacterium]